MVNESYHEWLNPDQDEIKQELTITDMCLPAREAKMKVFNKRTIYFIILVASIIVAAVGLDIRLRTWEGWIIVVFGLAVCVWSAWHLAKEINNGKK
jgi:hypothetical protein